MLTRGGPMDPPLRIRSSLPDLLPRRRHMALLGGGLAHAKTQGEALVQSGMSAIQSTSA